jgi:hypothetical protein
MPCSTSGWKAAIIPSPPLVVRVETGRGDFDTQALFEMQAVDEASAFEGEAKQGHAAGETVRMNAQR